MRSASPHLVELLQELDLCKPGDLRACHAQVRRLAKDLPAFDSVWVDALVQRRKLTPFQAQILLSGEPRKLNAGPCVLIDKLSYHEPGHTFLARRRESDERCVVRFVEPEAEQFVAVAHNLEQLSEVFQQYAHQAIAGPHASLQYDDRLVAVSRHVTGASIKETLVQIGRFTAADVVEIGRQLLSGLAGMERHWQAHGDIRIANLRLATDGTACLTNCGIAVATGRRFIVHHKLRPDRCDTVAPELIGTNRTPDAQSDLYALGCLLWQLLCGRPPFPCADPLEKLAAHQTQIVPDVREIAPDAPEWLAAAITSMTQRDRTQRPPSFSDASRRWNQHSGSRLPGPNALTRFSPRVREMARRSSPPRQATKWILAATALLSLSGAGLILANGGVGAQLLSLSGNPSATSSGNPVRTAEAHRGTVPEIYELPQPDPQGTISLPHAGPWRAGTIESTGPIAIVGQPDSRAVVQLSAPLLVKADTLAVQNVFFEVSGAFDGAMLDCQCRSVRLSHTQFVGSGTENGVQWSSPDRRDRSAQSLTVTDSTFDHLENAIEMRSLATAVNLGNVLFTRLGTVIRNYDAAQAGDNSTLQLIRVTTREVHRVLETPLREDRSAAGHFAVLLTDSVFSLAGEDAAVFTILGPQPQSTVPVLEVATHRDADSSLKSPNAKTSLWMNEGTGGNRSLEDLVFVDGIMPSPLVFRSQEFVGRGSEIVDFEAPRRSTAMPGWRIR